MNETIQKAREALASIPHGAIDALANNQRQLDMDGCEVGVSRQAVDEVLAGLRAALAALDAETEVKATRGLADLSVAMAGDIVEIITGKPTTPDQSAKVSLFIFKCATTGALPFEILAALVPPEARS